jgi:hypothetical protein
LAQIGGLGGLDGTESACKKNSEEPYILQLSEVRKSCLYILGV